MSRSGWPALAAAAVLFLMVAVLVADSLRLTDHRLVYPLDDAYIHMAVARNLSEHGVWGVTRHGFTACTSSLLWPLLLAAGHALGGRTTWLPLLLNLGGAVAALTVAARLLAGAGAAWRLTVLLALVFLTPLPVLVLAGMEHTLHVAATLLLAGLLVHVVDDPQGRVPWALPAVSAAATALRYESLREGWPGIPASRAARPHEPAPHRGRRPRRAGTLSDRPGLIRTP